jgi:ABC-type multidrug transport system fused ATPase/permease subunit
MFNRFRNRSTYLSYATTEKTSEVKSLYREFRRVIKYFYAETFGEKVDWTMASCTSIAGALINNAVPYLWLHVYGVINEKAETTEQDKQDDLQNVILLGLGMVCTTMFVRSLVDTARQNYMGLISGDAADKMRRAVIKQAMHPEVRSEDAILVSNDLKEATDSLNQFGQEMIGNMVPWLLELITASGIILQYGPEFGLYIVVYMTLFIMMTVKASAAMKDIEKQYHELQVVYESVGTELMKHKEEMNLYAVANRQLALQAQLGSEVRVLYKKMQRYGQLSPLLQNLMTAGYLYANFQSYASQSPTVNDLVLFTAYPITFSTFFNQMGSAFNDFRFTQHKLNEILEKLEDDLKKMNAALSPPAVENPTVIEISADDENVNGHLDQDPPSQPVLISEKTESERQLEWLQSLQPVVEKPARTTPLTLEFRDVSFSYQSPIKDILANANLALTPGGITALIGDNMSGKSTLIKIILQMCKPASGEVLVNGAVLTNDQLASTISVAPQKSTKFRGSFYYNLRFLNPWASEEDVNRYIDKFKLKRFCNPDEAVGVDSPENDIPSGGEEQMIGAIRTLLRKDADIYIFDETTSNLDPRRREKLMQILMDLAKTKIVIFSLHDRSLVEQYCSQVVFLHDKKLTLDTHQNLIGNNAEYQQYFRHIADDPSPVAKDPRLFGGPGRRKTQKVTMPDAAKKAITAIAHGPTA